MSNGKELEKRVEQLENRVYTESDRTQKEKIGFLQSKLRDAGEEFQELKDEVEKLRKRVEKVESEDEMLEKIKKEHRKADRKLEDLDESMEDWKQEMDDITDNHLSSMESVKEQIVELDNHVNSQIEHFNDAREVFGHHIIAQADFLAQFVVSGYSMAEISVGVIVDKYMPDIEEVDMLWDCLQDLHLVSYDKKHFLSSTISEYVRLVDYWEENIDGYETPRDEAEYFRAFLFNRLLTFLADERGWTDEQVEAEYHNKIAGKEYDKFKKICESIGADVSDYPRGKGQRVVEEEVENDLYVAELITIAVDDSTKHHKGAADFVQLFQDADAEGVMDMLSMAGVDSFWVNSWDEEKVMEIQEEIRDKELGDLKVQKESLNDNT